MRTSVGGEVEVRPHGFPSSVLLALLVVPFRKPGSLHVDRGRGRTRRHESARDHRSLIPNSAADRLANPPS